MACAKNVAKNMKKILITLSIVFLFVLAFFYQKNQTTKEVKSDEKKLQVSTSFYPLYFFTKEITQDRAEVINLTKTGAEPHDFEPSPKDILTIEQSQLLIVNGNFFESWLDKFDEEISKQGVKIIKVTENLATIKGLGHHHDEEEHEEEEEEMFDPHVWLDPVLAQSQVELINQELQAVDPDNASFYQANTTVLLQQLDDLHQTFTNQLQNCQNQEIITSHAAFAYMAERYGFEQIAIQGLNPDQDPSPAEIAAISNLAKSKQINYIFFETLVSPKIAQTIAQEIGAKTLLFNPLEGLTREEEALGQNYFTIQKTNLKNLSLALNCQP